jgi:hypothetical protein
MSCLLGVASSVEPKIEFDAKLPPPEPVSLSVPPFHVNVLPAETLMFAGR